MSRWVVLALLVGCSSPAKAPVSPSGPGPAVATPSAARPPATRTVDAADTFHGASVADPYRWLEETTPEVDAWITAQTAYAQKTIDASTELAALRAEHTAIRRPQATTYGSLRAAGKYLFVTRKRPDKDQAELVVTTDVAKIADATVVFDPNATPGAAIDWFVPSPDGSAIAIAVHSGGDERSVVHVVDRAGKELEPPVQNVSRATAGGSLAWTADGKGFYYTRYPAAGEEHESEPDNWQQVWFHARGTPAAKDRQELAKQLTKISQVRLFTNAGSRVLATVQNGDSGPKRYFVRGPNGWRMIADWADDVALAQLGARDDVWLISFANAPRGRVLNMPIDGSLAKAAVVVPEDAVAAIDPDFWSDSGFVDAGDTIYVSYQLGGPEELRRFTRAGKDRARVPVPEVASITPPRVWQGGVLVGATSYTTPFGWYFSKGGKTTRVEEMSRQATVDLSGFVATREFATSKDGTKVPYTVIAKKDAKRDGTQRCLATGYGGYGISITPNYVETLAPLLTRGVCIVFSNLRGGGEMGKAWHEAGMLVKKQNVFDDFIAVVDDLVAKKITARDRVAIEGGSNGGLLIGAVVTQRPDIARAALIDVGLLDSLRFELSANGATNIGELGSVKDPEQFRALRAYSPVHNVKPARYPAMLLTTGKNDGRVPPAHSYKMAAALQAAQQQGDAPILLFVDGGQGHGIGMGTSAIVEKKAQHDAFVLMQLAR